MILGLYNYWVVVVLMMVGFYIVIAHGNLIKKLLACLFSKHLYLFFISAWPKSMVALPPFWPRASSQYSNPLPHVLILTAIVVGIATTALALALAVRIKEAYGSVEEEEIQKKDNLDC